MHVVRDAWVNTQHGGNPLTALVWIACPVQLPLRYTSREYSPRGEGALPPHAVCDGQSSTCATKQPFGVAALVDR